MLEHYAMMYTDKIEEIVFRFLRSCSENRVDIKTN
jgi:hypothetical protein